MSRFRTVRISDPRFEKDHLRHMTIKSPNLRGRGDMTIFVPPDIEATDLPIVLLLHGVYGSAWSWALAAGAHLTAHRLIEEGSISPIILAMPSDGLWGDGSAYLRHNSINFEQWIVKDVIDTVREQIQEASDSQLTFIGGLSMGGFGALRLGAKYPQYFAAMSGLSAITTIDQMGLFVEEATDNFRQADRADHSVIDTILANASTIPPFRFDCGRDDILIEHNRLLHQQLVAANIPHEYFEYEGQHEWSYWEEHLEDILIFFDNIRTS